MTTNLDDRVRVLMARLGDATPIAPEFESLTSRPMVVVAAPVRPTRRWAPLVAAAAAVALVVGAIAIYRVRENDTTSAITPSTKQVATDLPDGWSLVKAVGPGTQTFEGMPPGRMNIYATEAAPLGPVVGISTEPMRGGERVDATTVTLPDGRRAILSDYAAGLRWADVEVTSGTWVSMQARGLDDPTILTLASSITLTGDQMPAFATAAAGLSLVGASEYYLQPFWTNPDSAPASLPQATTVTRYAPTTGSDSIDVTTFVPTALTRAALGLWADVSATEGGVIGQVPRQDGSTGFYAERDGFAFYATGPTAMIDEIRALVASLAPVSDAEWQRLVGDGSPQTTETIATANSAVPETTSVDTTAAPPPSAATTVDISAVAAPTATPGEFTVVLTAPDGSTTTFTVRYLGRTITAMADPAFGGGLSSDIDVAPRSSGASITNGGGFGFVTANVPATSDAVWMSVVADGVRYRIELVQPDPTYPVKLGVFLVRTTASASDMDPILLDKNGNQTYGV